MSKKVKVFLVIVVCVGAILGGFFSYKKYLNNLNNENKEKTNMEEKQDNKEPDKNEVKEETKYKIVKNKKERYVDELSEDKYNIKDDIGTTKVTISNKNTNELVKEYQFSDNDSCYFSKIIYDEKILGYIEAKDSGKSKICTYLNDCFETEYEVIGEYVILSCDDDFYTLNKEAIIVKKDKKVALLSLRTGKLISDFVYDELHGISNNRYIAVKDGKAGIVDVNYNVKVDFIYDYIADYNDFYVASKEGKLAIMDKNYKLITDFLIVADFNTKDYNYTPCCGHVYPQHAIKIGDNYVLDTHNSLYNYEEPTDEKEAFVYFIKNDGSYEKIYNSWNLRKINESLFYVQDTKRNSTFYDSNFKKLYTINDSYFERILKDIMSTDSSKGRKFYDIFNGNEITSLPKYEFYNISLEYVKTEDKGYTNWGYNIYVDGKLYLKNISNVEFKEDGSFKFIAYENNVEYEYELQKI